MNKWKVIWKVVFFQSFLNRAVESKKERAIEREGEGGMERERERERA